MNILEIGMEQGLERGMEQGIGALIETCQELGISRDETSIRLMKKFSLQEDTAEMHLSKYWQEQDI